MSELGTLQFTTRERLRIIIMTRGLELVYKGMKLPELIVKRAAIGDPVDANSIECIEKWMRERVE